MDDFTRLKAEVEKLPIQDKLRLISELLRKIGLDRQIGGGNYISTQVVLQIQNVSTEQLIEIVRALTENIGKESKKNTEPTLNVPTPTLEIDIDADDVW